MTELNLENICPVCGTDEFEINYSDSDFADDTVFWTWECHCPKCNINWMYCKVYEQKESYYEWIGKEEGDE